jgi:hypothetical protein
MAKLTTCIKRYHYQNKKKDMQSRLKTKTDPDESNGRIRYHGGVLTYSADCQTRRAPLVESLPFVKSSMGATV